MEIQDVVHLLLSILDCINKLVISPQKRTSATDHLVHTPHLVIHPLLRALKKIQTCFTAHTEVKLGFSMPKGEVFSDICLIKQCMLGGFYMMLLCIIYCFII